MNEQSMEGEPRPTPKIDPETLVLRGAPPRTVRFRTDVIIAAASAAALAIAGVGWFALKAHTGVPAANADNGATNTAKPLAEALADAPKTYGDVPQLGPALPGDLGKPILERQQALGTAPVSASANPANQAAQAERQRLAAEGRSARESGIMMQIAGGQKAAATGASSIAVPATTAPATLDGDAKTAKLALDPEHDPGSQQRKSDFLTAKDGGGDTNRHVLTEPTSPYTLSAGTVLSASLITGLNSDLPGLVMAQVTENVYDTPTGRILLVPQGSRLIGSYDSVVAYGQKRALVVWQRLMLPDGSSLRIDNVPATDTAGYAGLADKVDVHTWQLLKGVALSTLLGVGTQVSFGDNESDLVRAIRESTQQSTSKAGDQIVSHALNIQPTITVRSGWPLRVVVHKDIVLRPWGGEGR